MSIEELRKRLERLREQLREAFGSGPDGFMSVLVEGGLCPLPAIASDDTGHEWIRDVAGGESVEAFAQRAARESRGYGARLCTIGGMGTGTPLQDEALRAAHDEYMRTEYDDVPPMEKSRGTAPARRARE
jgi:hypothetical protein